MHQRVTYFESAFNYCPQLLAHSILGILDLEVAPLGHYLLGSERPFSEPPSRVSPPLLHGINVLLVKLVFMVYGRHWYGIHERLLICQICCNMTSFLCSVALASSVASRECEEWFRGQGVLLTWTEGEKRSASKWDCCNRSECPGQA